MKADSLLNKVLLGKFMRNILFEFKILSSQRKNILLKETNKKKNIQNSHDRSNNIEQILCADFVFVFSHHFFRGSKINL